MCVITASRKRISSPRPTLKNQTYFEMLALRVFPSGFQTCYSQAHHFALSVGGAR